MKKTVSTLILLVCVANLIPAKAISPGKKHKVEVATQLFSEDSCTFGDCKNGIGASINENGDIYYGRWFRSKPHGFGTIYFNPENSESGIPSGTLLVVRFNNGTLDGLATFDSPGGKKLSVLYHKSLDIDSFEEKPEVKPQGIRFTLPYTYPWEGRSIRRAYYLENGEAKRGTISIHPFSEENKCFYTMGEVKGITLPFLFDTGCTQTALSTDYITYLREEGVKIQLKGSDTFETACGLIELNEYVIEELTIGDLTFYNLQVGETQSSDNLLGMDIIAAFGSYKAIPDEHLIILE
jgi:predicted aspartyl protease